MPINNIAFEVVIDPKKWEQTGPEDNPRSRLLATGIINGHHFHVEAYEVKPWVSGEEQAIADDTFDHEWAGICSLNECALCTQEIGGRPYVIIMQPFGD